MKEKLKPIFSLFSGLQILFSMLVIFLISGGYLYLTTKHLIVSMVMAILSLGFSFYYLVYIPKKIKREQFLLKELQKYATNMTFFLQSGYNVPKALQMSKKSLDPEIQKDIDLTIDTLQKEAVLNTDHFKKYNFPSINIFHQILKIKYEVGGNAKELFTKVNQSINFEIVKRDELYRRKRYIQNKIHAMVIMVLFMPLILLYFAKELYMKFLDLGFLAIGTNVALFFCILISLFLLQKATADISIID